MNLAAFTLFLVLIISAVNVSGAQDDAVLTETQQATARQFHELLDDQWDRRLRQNPTFASWLGDKRFNDRWQDISLDAIRRRHGQDQNTLRQLDQIDAAQLVGQDRISFDLFRREYQNSVDSFRYGWHLVPLNQRGGIQDENSLADAMSFSSLKDYEDWIARLSSFPTYMNQTIALLREGIRRKIVHAKIIMQRVPTQIERQIVDDPRRSLFYKPFRNIDSAVTEADQQRLRDAAASAIARHVVPSFQKLLAFINDEYVPACYDRVGVWQFPDGKAFYAQRAREFTTTDLTPKEIHEIGLAEVKRIRAQMEQIVREVEFNGTFHEFLADLRTNPEFYFEDANDLLVAYREVCMRINPQLVKLFRRLPRIPYGIEPIPEHLAPDTTTAYYRPPSADGLRAGTYFVNLYRPEVRPKYEIEVLSVHEAVPGHHLQIALAQELEGIPLFRRYGGYTAFIEGWGLYSESLGNELGLYQDPYSRFGQLTYEMWRAVRLVVDTGMHAFGWSRQQAIDFFADNTAKTMLDIENEVDRYIAWPGQALAYKIGELKIQELRRRAEQQLGDQFDIRAFHDTVLGNGAVTLDILERIVDEWIDESCKPNPVPR
ncbi:MAG: DUF885 domain-containing protein [Planctomycetota bacterium]|jgi:prolyl oligopeptidase